MTATLVPVTAEESGGGIARPAEMVCIEIVAWLVCTFSCARSLEERGEPEIVAIATATAHITANAVTLTSATTRFVLGIGVGVCFDTGVAGGSPVVALLSTTTMGVDNARSA